jgi:hypothetical protein
MPTNPLLKVATLPSETQAEAANPILRWTQQGQRLDVSHGHGDGHAWWKVLWLTGVDYFSTLAYQPGIALVAAGMLSPIATAVLLLVTMFCALPVYRQVAGRSFVGQGSIAIIENLFSGWRSKLAVLILVGFASTDFVITMTLSSADAAKHAIENPLIHPYLAGGHAQTIVTLALLAVLVMVFIKGFSEAIYVSMGLAIPYILLTAVVAGRGFMEVLAKPELLSNWTSALNLHGSWHGLVLASLIVYPKLALGLSGFETGVMVMAQVKGKKADYDEGQTVPLGRVKNTRKLLTSAAVLMSVMLLSCSWVTTLLIPAAEYGAGGKAEGRAMAYLAHNLLGHTFGTLYDISTIAILWFAGASAMAGLLSLIPRYLPRFGMAPSWTIFDRPLILLIWGVTILVTLIFKADVEAQAGAYATGILVLMFADATAVAISLWREGKAKAPGTSRATLPKSVFFWVVTAIFGYTLIDNVWERHDGIIIASFFIVSIILLSAYSRYQRATELRVLDMAFISDEAADLWPTVVGKKVNLVPLRGADPEARRAKAAEVRSHFAIQGPLAFVHCNLADNRSEFLASLRVNVEKEDDDYIITVDGAVAIANTIAYISELIDPKSLVLGLTRQNLMTQAFKYILWGEGETGLMVYTILLRYWDWTPEEDVRPLIFLMSEGSSPYWSDRPGTGRLVDPTPGLQA